MRIIDDYAKQDKFLFTSRARFSTVADMPSFQQDMDIARTMDIFASPIRPRTILCWLRSSSRAAAEGWTAGRWIGKPSETWWNNPNVVKTVVDVSKESKPQITVQPLQIPIIRIKSINRSMHRCIAQVWLQSDKKINGCIWKRSAISN